MLKRIFIPILIPVLFACNQPAKQSADSDTTASTEAADSSSVDKSTPADYLITPGKGIGHLIINSSVDSAIALLGRPDSSDGAMGRSLMTWYADHKPTGYRTSIFAHHNLGGKDEMVARIQKIMVTSPAFKTADGISTGSTLDHIKTYYTLKPEASFMAGRKNLKVYNDVTKGIAFDVDSASNVCEAITVHKAGDTSGTYLNMH